MWESTAHTGRTPKTQVACRERLLLSGHEVIIPLTLNVEQEKQLPPASKDSL